ncbi:MAG: phosphotransferase family protein [Alphaproteobacteria bacterium]|nr:phosphotransferase family protein [Alphaproteobacteria bacterium]
MSDVIVAPSTRDLDDLRRDLANWMQLRLPDATGITIDNLDYPRGAGQSHETILFDAHWNEGGEKIDQGFVVRFKPLSFIMFPDDLWDQQIEVMRVFHDDGRIPVARVWWKEDDERILGGKFYVMEKKYGRVTVSVPPYSMSGWFAESSPEQRHRAWRQGVEAMARLHTMPVEMLQFLKGPAGAEQGLPQEWDKWSRYVDWVNADGEVPILGEALAHLESTKPDHTAPGLVWGDCRIGNMMFDANYDLIAVMDWEQPSLGGSLNDLAWWIVLGEQMHGATGFLGKHLEGMGTRQDTIDLWQSITGQSVDGLAWYEDFMALKTTLMSIRMGRMRGQGPMMDPETMRQRLRMN